MADKLDEYLREYHTGGLDLLIKQRKEDLKFHDEPDENIGGGRAQNSKTNRVELEMIVAEEDELICEWETRKQAIKVCLQSFTDIQKQVFNLRYRQRASWATVDVMVEVPKRTGIRWCNELKDELKKYIK